MTPPDIFNRDPELKPTNAIDRQVNDIALPFRRIAQNLNSIYPELPMIIVEASYRVLLPLGDKTNWRAVETIVADVAIPILEISLNIGLEHESNVSLPKRLTLHMGKKFSQIFPSLVTHINRKVVKELDIYNNTKITPDGMKIKYL